MTQDFVGQRGGLAGEYTCAELDRAVVVVFRIQSAAKLDVAGEAAADFHDDRLGRVIADPLGIVGVLVPAGDRAAHVDRPRGRPSRQADRRPRVGERADAGRDRPPVGRRAASRGAGRRGPLPALLLIALIFLGPLAFAAWLAPRSEIEEIDHRDVAEFLASPAARERPDGKKKKASSMNSMSSRIRDSGVRSS